MMKIMATIGPASIQGDILREFAKITKVFRLNGSHASIEWHKNAITEIRNKCSDAFILLDIPGIKPRTNNETELHIGQGERVRFGLPDENQKILTVSLTKPLPEIKGKISYFSVNDGQYEFSYETHGDGYIVGKSRSNFTLLPKKGVNLPMSIYDEKKQAIIYQEFITKVKELDIDALGLSFVQTGSLVNKIREIAPNLILVSKIENLQGLKNCTEIVQNSDAIMIDRGDLFAEIGHSGFFQAVTDISDSTKSNGKPLIMATENLESMLSRNVPSKSEIMSLAHSASIGVDCIMLSEETATSHTGLDTLLWLNDFLQSSDKIERVHKIGKVQSQFLPIWESLKYLEDTPKVLITKSGYALHQLLSMNADRKVTLISDNHKLFKLCNLYSNEIVQIERDVGSSPLEILWDVLQENTEEVFDKSSQIAAIYVSKYLKTARANSLTIFDKSDFIK